MAGIYDAVYTIDGQILLADTISKEAVFDITKIEIGSGYLPEGKPMGQMTGLVNVVAELPVKKKQRTEGSAEIIIGTDFNNSTVAHAFYYREIGVFAKAVYPDNTESEEILYMYGNAGDSAQYIPVHGEAIAVEKKIDIVTYIGADTKVSLKIAEYLNVGREEFEQGIGALNVEIERIEGRIDTLPLFKVKLVNVLPELEISEQTLYLIPAEGAVEEGKIDPDKCLAYVRKGGRWKQLISKTDLSGYYNKAEVDLKLTSDETAANLFGKPMTFTEAGTDSDIASGDSLKVILGKLLKTIKSFRTKHASIDSNITGIESTLSSHGTTLQNLSGTTPITRGGTGETARYESVELTRKTANTPADSTATCRYYPYLKMCFARIYIAPRNTLTYKAGEAYVLYTIPEKYRSGSIHAGSCHVGGSANGTVRVSSTGEIAFIPDKDITVGWLIYITAFWLL